MSDLAATLAALDTVIELGTGRLDERHVEEAAALRSAIDQRLALGDGLTVVAVAGGTGVGKSSLVNRLVGAQVTEEGLRRPTTGWPLAVTSADPGAPADALLRWLQVDDRVVAPPGFPDQLVLIDLPDHDSVVAANRETAHRLASRVDGLVVVVDPVKYARADLHHGPLAALTDHAEVVTVVLNRIDELAPGDVARCLDDLASRLAEQLTDGHADPVLLATSASTGAGIEPLRERLRALAETRSAAHRRLIADAATLARRIEPELRSLPDPLPERVELHEALMVATDANRRIVAAGVAYRRDAATGTRSPLARAVRLPLRGLGGVARAFGVGEHAPEPGTTRSASGRIESVLNQQLRLHATTGSAHAALTGHVATLAEQGAPALADVVGGVGIRPEPRSWWTAMAAGRGGAESTAAVGFVWLALLGVADWLRLPEIPTPQLTEALSWPTALLIGGVLLRVALGLATRVFTARGARHHARGIERQVRAGIDQVTEQRLLGPFRDELDRHTRLREAVTSLSPRRR